MNHDEQITETPEYHSEKPSKEPPFEIIGDPTALFSAMAEAQGDFDDVAKTTTGRKGNQTYKYAPMPDLRRAAIPSFRKHGISVSQYLTAGSGGRDRIYMVVAGHGAVIKTYLEFSPMPMDKAGGDATIKDYGAFSTYLRRYQFQALGLLDGDRDADEESKDIRAPKRQPQAPEEPQEEPRGEPTEVMVLPETREAIKAELKRLELRGPSVTRSFQDTTGADCHPKEATEAQAQQWLKALRHDTGEGQKSMVAE